MSHDPPAIHPLYLRLLHGLLQRRGWSSAALDAAVTGLDERWPGLLAVRQAVDAALASSACPWLGLELGAAVDPHMHGAVGSATLASRSLREALSTLTRFAPLRIRALRIECRESRHALELRLIPALPLGAAERFIIDATLVVLRRLLDALAVGEPQSIACRLPWPAPAWAAVYAAHLYQPPSFGQGPAALLIPADWLERPCLSADAALHALALRECEWRLGAGAPGREVALAIRREILARPGEWPSAAAMAARLHLSPRSLFRQLREAGIGYQAIVDELRAAEACRCLRDSDLPIEAIATRLGFEDPSNFARAFRRWMGCTPLRYRRSARAQP